MLVPGGKMMCEPPPPWTSFSGRSPLPVLWSMELIHLPGFLARALGVVARPSFETPRKHCCEHSTVAKWSILKMWVCPSSLETCYPEYIISVLSRMGRKIQVLKVVLLFLSKKAHSLHMVEIRVKWHAGENQIEDFWGHSKIRGAVRNPESFSLPREWINASSLYLWPCAFCPWPQRIWIVSNLHCCERDKCTKYVILITRDPYYGQLRSCEQLHTLGWNSTWAVRFPRGVTCAQELGYLLYREPKRWTRCDVASLPLFVSKLPPKLFLDVAPCL